MNNGGDGENEGYACLVVVVVGVWDGRVEVKREYNKEGIRVNLH